MKQSIESNDSLVVLTISDGKNKRYLVVAREELEKPLEQKIEEFLKFTGLKEWQQAKDKYDTKHDSECS